MSQALSQGARGGAITLAGEATKLIVQVAGLLVLSRLLSPEDFGIVAMATVFLALGELLRDFGIPTAALSAPTLSRAQASNLFWVSTGIGAIAAILLLGCTPLIVALYGQPELATILPFYAASLLLNGVQVQYRVHLARAMRFKALAITDVFALVGAFSSAVVFALLGFGYYALVAQAVGYVALQLLARMIVSRWIPGRPRRSVGTRKFIVSGAHIGLSQLLTYGASNVDTVAIGVFWGPTVLGYYNRAFQLLTTPQRAAVGPLTNVVVPAARRYATEGGEIASILLRVQVPLALGSTWVYAVAAATAPALIPLVLGGQWGASVVIFQALAIGGVLQSLSYVNLWAFLLHQKTLALLRYNLVTKLSTIVVIALVAPLGPVAVALVYSLMLTISWPIGVIWLRVVSGQQATPFLSNGVRYIATGLLAYVAFVVLEQYFGRSWNDLWTVLAGVLTVSTVLFGAMLALPAGRRDLRSIRMLLLGLMPRSRES